MQSPSFWRVSRLRMSPDLVLRENGSPQLPIWIPASIPIQIKQFQTICGTSVAPIGLLTPLLEHKGGPRDGREEHVAKEDRGFASMDRAKQREIASKGGKAAHQKGTAHEWTSEEARDAGRKGGIASHRRRREQMGVAGDAADMAEDRGAMTEDRDEMLEDRGDMSEPRNQ